MSDEKREGPPALPGEVWRGVVGARDAAVCLDEDMTEAWVWNARLAVWDDVSARDSGPILRAWALHERARAEKAEADAAHWRTVAEAMAKT